MSDRNDEAQIRAVIEDRASAVRTKDAGRLVRHCAPDVVSFDLSPPLKTTGSDPEGLEAWFGDWRGPLGYEVTDLDVTAAGEVAFARSLDRITGTNSDGEATSIWLRATLCFRRIDGDWKVVHAHISVPFYMDGSFQAAVDLEPDGR